jgi:carboxypeptidase C (cathepsin A)
VVGVLGLAALAGPARAQDHGAAAPSKPAEAAASSAAGALALLPAEPSTTRHELRLGGRSLDYRATAGTLPLRDGAGEVTAQVFHVAYALEEPEATDRPVTFLFNGGPGAASAFLMLGGVGPRMVAFSEAGGYLPPPSRLVDNPDTWLAFTDLVFVDPVGTGYSRAAQSGEEADRRFFGVRQDASAMAAFIRLWLAREKRTLSPVFLAGESYGGFRAAVLAHALQEESGITPSGVVLISPALEFLLLRGEEFALLPWAVSLPSMAAVHLERQGMDPADLGPRLEEVERFALSDYLVNLAAGPGDLAPEVVATLARVTGLSPELARQSYGRISVSRFIKEYDRASRRVLSRYDGTVSGPDPDPASPNPGGPDPVLDRAVPVWTSAFVAYAREELGFETDVTYRLLNPELAGGWDYGTPPSRQGYAGALDELQAARTLSPSLQVLIAHGYADLVTPYFASRYLVDQLPPLAGAAPIELEVYPGGHMMYTRPGSRRALTEDARLLYRRALAPAASEMSDG